MSLSPSPRPEGALIARRYLVERKLGTGSFGTVYLARDLAAERLVAVKILRAERWSPEAITRLQDEFRTIAMLRHPQIAAAYDFGYTEGGRLPYYTRETIEGAPLPPGPPPPGVPPEAFLQPILDILDALTYVHQRGILHLDIHAGNCIVAKDEDRGTVLIDFGLGRVMEASGALDTAARGPGIPPELAGSGRWTPLTDVYLVGRLLEYRLTGSTEDPVRLPREIPGWGVRRTLDLERTIAKAVMPAPRDRFLSAAEFRRAVSSVLEDPPPRRPSSEPQRVTIGRDRELKRIDRALSRVEQGKTSCLWLAGRTGSGRSHLLDDARRSAQLRGFATVEVAFHATRDPEPLLSKALRKLRLGGAARAPWVSALDPSHGGTPEERAERAAVSLLSNAEIPLVMLLDDIQAADRESEVFARALWSEAARWAKSETSCAGVGIFVSGPPAVPTSVERADVMHVHPLPRGIARRLLSVLLAPLVPPRPLVNEALAGAKGSPLRLRHIARSLIEAWGPAGVIPDAAELPPTAGVAASRRTDGRGSFDQMDREVLEAVVALERGVTRQEISSALERPVAEVGSSLRKLARRGVVTGHGRPRIYRIAFEEDRERYLEAPPAARVRHLHGRVAALLENQPTLTPVDLEHLARHHLRAGRRARGRKVARKAAALLKAAGSFDRAAGLLRGFAESEPSLRQRIELVEEISAILEESGDHQTGVALVETLYREHGSEAGAREWVRLGRRLGTHLHRAGSAEEALRVFEETMSRADPARDLEDLAFIDSELAELHLFRGSIDAAEEACRRGLDRIERRRGPPQHGRRTEVVLRASLGHIELRRMRPEAARKALLTALDLSRSSASDVERAGILHNLAVTSNMVNALAEARRYFLEAEALLRKAGHHRDVVKICTNLAVIAAKRGEVDEAIRRLDSALHMVRMYPSRQLEFFALYSKGIVSLTLGEAVTAAEAFHRALPLGRRLGDRYLVRFGEVYLAEALLAAGRYADAQRQLQSTTNAARAHGPPVLVRMASSRLYLVESLLGRTRRAARALGVMEEAPRSDVLLLETWSDLYCGLGHLASGNSAGDLFDRARSVFGRLGIPFGVRFSWVGALLDTLVRGDPKGVRTYLREGSGAPETPHPLLDVAESSIRAEAYLFLDQPATVETWLARAAGEIIGRPFLELDWRIELLRAQLASRTRDLEDARRHLHRSLHACDHMVERVPVAARRSFRGHRRFRMLDELAAHLERSPRDAVSTARLWSSGSYEGITGKSPPMVRLFRSIEDLRDQEIPVLISGETGTGKELVARAIYRRSPRSGAPFQALHCACLPDELFESELFGYTAGAFTGAEEDHGGLFEALDGGTVLLDEVGELSVRAQARLLEVLDTGVIRRLGSRERRKVDIRFLFASTMDLDRAVEEGRLRQDLLFRMGALQLALPPLRERREDIPLLARHLLQKHSARLNRPAPTVDDAAMRILQDHPWPGNVRELEAILLGALVTLSRGQPVGARDIRPLLDQRRPAAPDVHLLDRSLEEWRTDLDRRYLTQLFFDTGGNLKRMLERLGIRRTTLYGWFRRLEIDVAALRREVRHRAARGEG